MEPRFGLLLAPNFWYSRFFYSGLPERLLGQAPGLSWSFTSGPTLDHPIRCPR